MGRACSTNGGKPEGKRQLGRPKRRWLNNIKMDLREIVWDGMDWIDLAEDRNQWRDLVNTSSRPALGSTQPPMQLVSEALSQGVKRPGREADHSSPTSAEVKKMWIYTSTHKILPTIKIIR
jgi:hypothetical protein